MRYTTPRVARGALFERLALSALRCVLSGFERRSVPCDESGVYGASTESCIRLADIALALCKILAIWQPQRLCVECTSAAL